jgi:hypothetical protein
VWGKLGDMINNPGKAFKFNPGFGPLATWGSRASKVNDIWAMPCKTTPELWVRAFWQVAPAAIFKAIKPSPIDFLIIRFGFGHHRGKRKFFDFWDFSFNPRVPKSGFGWQVFKIGSLGARFLWYIAVIDAFTWGVLNWSSLVYQWAGCLAPSASWGANNFNPLLSFPPGTGPGFLNNWLVEDYHGSIVCTSISISGTTSVYGMGWTCEFAPHPLHPKDFGPPEPFLCDYPSEANPIQPDHKTVTTDGASYSFFQPAMPMVQPWQKGIFIPQTQGWSIWSGGSWTAYANMNGRDLLPDP